MKTQAEQLASEMQRYGVTTMNRWACDGASLIRAQAAEIERLTTCLKKANDQGEHFEREWYLRGDAIERKASEIERLKDDLNFIERWANHHGQKPHVTAEQALGVIQHYPPIKAITKAYSDGKVPDTYDPYFEIERLTAELGDLPEAQAMLLSDCKRKDTLLREALEALGTRCGTNADERGPSGVITKIKTELGETKWST